MLGWTTIYGKDEPLVRVQLMIDSSCATGALLNNVDKFYLVGSLKSFVISKTGRIAANHVRRLVGDS